MIGARIGSIVAALAAFAFSAGAAQADVLEIADDGEARWVAGGAAATLAQGAANGGAQPDMTPATTLPENFAVPQQSIADPSHQARLVPLAYAAKVAELAQKYDLSPTLIEALVWQESRWNARARSHAGARGLAQLMPGTAREMGVNPDEPFANLEGGARYLRIQLNRFNGDLEKALAAYNAGPGRVERAGGVPNIRETQNYVAAIMGRLSDHSREK